MTSAIKGRSRRRVWAWHYTATHRFLITPDPTGTLYRAAWRYKREHAGSAMLVDGLWFVGRPRRKGKTIMDIRAGQPEYRWWHPLAVLAALFGVGAAGWALYFGSLLVLGVYAVLVGAVLVGLAAGIVFIKILLRVPWPRAVLVGLAVAAVVATVWRVLA